MKRLIAYRAAFAVLMVIAVALSGIIGASAASPDANAQVAELHDLHAAFHRALTVRNPNGPDSQAVVEQRLADLLSLWAENGTLTLMTGPTPRQFAGRGVPGTASCAPGSGTLCDFYANLAPPFQPGVRLVSLSPSYKTNIEVHGDSARIYFECHLFDASTWAAMSHITFDGTARKVDGHWRFTHADVPTAGVPYP